MPQDADFLKNGVLSLSSYNLMIVDTYNYQQLLNEVNRILRFADSKEFKDWSVVAQYLSQYFYWEYENEVFFKE